MCSILILLMMMQVPGGDWNQLLHIDNPASHGNSFGFALAGPGDLDHDSIEEIFIGAPTECIFGTGFQGAAYVFSGATGNQLRKFEGIAESEGFGISMDYLGDIDVDGTPDLLVGSGSQSVIFPGRVSVISGETGVTIYSIQSTQIADLFGQVLASCEDIDGDSVVDFVVGAPWASPGGLSLAGEALVFSGKTGSLLFRYQGTSPGIQLGWNVGCLGDISGDGISDLAASSFVAGLTGSIHIISGENGSLLFEIDGFSFEEQFGSSLDGIGDINGDGLGDFIIGASSHYSGPWRPGAAYVLSGADASIIYQYEGEGTLSAFGSGVLGTGDLDMDSIPDFAVAARTADFGGIFGMGAVYVYSGRDGALLHRFQGQELEYKGRSLASIGDMTGDGRREIMFYENAGVPPGTRNPGAIGIYSFDSFLEADRLSISSSQGGTVKFDHIFPISEGGKAYRLLASSDRRGIAHWNGVEVPLAKTWLLHRTAFGGLGGIPGAVGSLDSNGHAVTLITLNPGAASAFIGQTIGFASVTLRAPDQPSLSSARALVEIKP
ncbi:MAG: hypothetical protein DWQ01_16670 [Planctomycetota bacterium]|nr:MAG: hypothetical protein DWQ01_16670 [Planctomycetota bacterium]